MSLIGPQLPHHLTKRKRTPEDEDRADSPPSKATRRANADEIDLDSDSHDEFGPSTAPTNSSAAKQPIGPTLPPKPSNGDEIPLDDSDDDTGPAPAPSSQPKRIIGPAGPPPALSERPTTDHNSDSDSDSDSDYGPALPGAAPSNRPAQGPAAGPSLPQNTTAPARPQRDDWMLAPPGSSSGYRAPDPTKLKARKFASGRAAGGGGGGGGVSSIWTETAEEKQRRLADAVLGRSADFSPTIATAAAPTAAAARDRDAEAREAQIRSYTESTRGKSLYEEHQAARKEGKATGKGGGWADQEEDDPSKRAFDREKDMGLGAKISHSQRRELLNRAADFGGRFQKGRYL